MSDYYATTAVLSDGTVKKVKLEDYIGSYVLLLFYPGDFDLLAKNQILTFAKNHERFEKHQCQVKK